MSPSHRRSSRKDAQLELGIVDVGLTLDIYGEVIGEDTGTLLFALGGGLVGGWYGAKLGRKPR